MFRFPTRHILFLGAAFTALTAYAQTPAHSKEPKVAGMRDVIVILRDQMPDVQPVRELRQARASAMLATQSSLIEPLQQAHARKVQSFRMINGFATSVTAAEAASLQNNPRVQAVVSDAVIRLPRPKRDLLAESAGGPGAGVAEGPTGPEAAQCNTLEPEALQLTNTAFLNASKPQAQTVLDGHGHPVTGRGVRVAYIADGLDPTLPGFTRPDGSSVFFDYQDFTGDPAGTPTSGAEAFGDASSIAAQDMPDGSPLYYDISQYGSPAHPIASPCNIRIRGVAPGASLAGFNIFSSLGYTTTSTFVQAIEWAVFVDDVDVINESFGFDRHFDSANDPVSLANTAAVHAGVTVVVSTGDSGTAGTLSSPATNTDVIAAGASTSFRIYAQLSEGALPLAKGYVSDNISSLSSGGFAERSPRTVDVVAPGDLGWALCSPNIQLYQDCASYRSVGAPIQDFGGTSESAPLTSGEAALVIQAYRSTHHDASPSPALVKRIIMSTATDLGAPADEQGAGLINTLGAVNAALSLDDEHGKPKNRGDTLLIDLASAEVVDKPNSLQYLTFKIRNTGTEKRHFAPRLQTLGAPDASEKVTLTLAPATAPTFIYVNGAKRAYLTHKFVVPAGAQHLDAAMAYKQLSSDTLVWMALLDPAGRQAAYSLPQGEGNGYGHVDVVKPEAGTWTAIIFTRVSGSTSYAGPVHFSWSTERFAALGTIYPGSFELEPGEATTVIARFNMPAHPGDTAAALRLNALSEEPGAGEPAVPITVRTLVPLGTDFSGTLTGGNGRAGGAPTQTFEFNVPDDAKGLSLGLHVADRGYPLVGFLVDPHGMPLSVGANADPLTGDPLTAMQLYHEHPQAGRWHFVLLQNFASSGKQTSLPFTARIGLKSLPYSLPGMPNEEDRKLSASQTYTVPVTVTNNSAVTQVLFADARLRQTAISQLPLYLCSDTITLPGICLFTYVPPEVNDVQFVAQSNVPINMDAENINGFGPVGYTYSPDIFAHSIGPDTVAASLHTHEVPWGGWYISPSLIGPYGSEGAQPAPVEAAVEVNMRPFDPAISSDSGDVYSDLVLGTNTFNPLVLEPGASGIINVTLQPDPSNAGQVVKGYVYLDNFNFASYVGDEIERIPYAYTVIP